MDWGRGNTDDVRKYAGVVGAVRTPVHALLIRDRNMEDGDNVIFCIYHTVGFFWARLTKKVSLGYL